MSSLTKTRDQREQAISARAVARSGWRPCRPAIVSCALLLCLSARLSAAPAAAGQPAHAGSLRCEYLENPLGIDQPQPRLSWQIVDPRRGAHQTAWQILVASSQAELAADRGDLWDSGPVESDQSIHVVYQGKPLRSHQACWWKVRIWDHDGKPTGWSQPANWSMGILQPAQWQAKWLEYTMPFHRTVEPGSAAEQLKLADASWIWTAEGDAAVSVPKGKRFFRRTIELPGKLRPRWAYLVLAADDNFRLWLNGAKVSENMPEDNAWHRAYEVELTEKLTPGRNVLAVDADNLVAGPAGLAMKLVVELADGQRLSWVTDEAWKATATPAAGGAFFAPDLDDSAWKPAAVVGKVGIDPWKIPQTGANLGWVQEAPSPVFRKTFSVAGPVRRATAYVCGLGYHELRLNGSKVGDHVLDPAFTRYDRRALYVTHDLTSQIRQGQNALGVMLGNGWYNMHTRATWNFDQAPWRARPTLLFHLRIELEDGSVQTVTSDGSWQATTGPVVLDSIRAGEVYDARREMPGWDTAPFDARAWDRPQIGSGPAGVLSAQMMPPIRVTGTVEPVAVSEPQPGIYVFDMGRHFSGWAQLRLRGRPGTQVTLRYSERLDPAGMIERSEISKFVFEGPFQVNTYVLNGQGLETWEPRFTYNGFRYVEVTGLDQKPAPDLLLGKVVHTDFARPGRFECSNPLFNRLVDLTDWSYRSNYHGYPTDCPQREKNGWTGDAHLAAEQAMYRFENTASYLKWIQDIHDEQRDSGEICAIVPTSGWGYAWGNGPAWDSAFLLIPWYVYTYRGDLKILADHYDRMRLYVDYLAGKAENGIVTIGLGDWVPADTVTPNTITSTAYYYVDATIVAQAAGLLGKADDARKYTALADQIRKAFNREFYKGDGLYLNGSQTALSCALYQGLVDDSQREAVVTRLAEQVAARNDHLDVGILGAKYLFHALSQNGHHELACRILNQKTPPSYGDWVEKGATTLWEDWQGISSLNHIMFGDVVAWFYQQLAGINADPDRPGFKHVIIRPRPAAGLDHVTASTESMYGTIRSAWKKGPGGSFTLDVTLPPNTTGTVYVPAASQAHVKADGARFHRIEAGSAVYEIQSGSYRFETK
ncbi:MAG: glycoside hydrolase family 78 protein [Thermoguttaceae bacterium]